MRRTVFAFVFALFVSTAAQAVTLRDIVELTKAGLGDEVLLALIDVDGGAFDIDAATLKSLKAAGVSERVIVALVRSGRERPVAPAQGATLADVVSQQAAPEVVYVDRPAPTVVHEVAVPYPVYVGVPVVTAGGRGRHERVTPPAIHLEPSMPAPGTMPSAPGHYSPTCRRLAPRSRLWGTSGKLRPDAWKPPVSLGSREPRRVEVRSSSRISRTGFDDFTSDRNRRGRHQKPAAIMVTGPQRPRRLELLVQIAVHVVRQRLHRQLPMPSASPRPARRAPDAFFFPRHLFASILPVR